MALNFKEYGQGDPIIILHGLFGTLDNWQTIARKLAEEFSVYLIDQRNHGRSPHYPEIDYPLMAEDLHQFMEDNWIYEARIIGHSMGGKTAMQFALNYPDMVEKLVVVDIGIKAYVGGHQTIFDALFEVDMKTLESRKQADEILSKKIEDKGVRQFLLKNLTRKKEGGFEWKMNLEAIYKSYPKILEAISAESPFEGPSLFIRGGKSKYIQDGDWDEINKLFPAANLQSIDNSGHWVHAEAPTELLNTLNTFLI